MCLRVQTGAHSECCKSIFLVILYCYYNYGWHSMHKTHRIQTYYKHNLFLKPVVGVAIVGTE